MNQTSFSSLVVPVLPAIGLPTSLTTVAGAALHDAFHHRGDLIGGHRIDHLLAAVEQGRLGLIVPFGGVAADAFALVVLVDGVAVAVLDAVDQRRLHPAAAVVEHRIGGDHAQHGGLAGAERVGQIRRQFVIDAEPLGVFGDQRHADVLREPHRHHVARLFEAEAQGRRAIKLAAVVFRPPDAAALPHVDFDGRIHDDARRRVAVVERRRIDERLERRARLPQRLRRAVELALVEGEAADHGEHAAGARIHHHHGAGDFGDLPQPVLALVVAAARHRRRRRRRAPG